MKTEADTRKEYIDPALDAAKWGHNLTEGSQVSCEFKITDGRMLSGGARAKQKFADYVLSYKNQKLAIIEAKKEDEEPTEGLEQVKDYARLLNLRIVYATNGKKNYCFDMESGRGDFVDQYPTPDELYRTVNGVQSDIHERVFTEPFHKTKYDPRYYQENAINAALSAITKGDQRVLLTLATGTGKTFIAFQIVWKLFNARWNNRGNERRPRVLFLADRNVLIDQALGDFNPLEGEIIRVNGEEIRKRGGKIPTNANIFFSIYQAMTGGGDNPYYMDYPSDFFDLIIIDECHRGGASNDGNWRAVLNHFSSATHLGLTATPKRDANVDTYDYFGDPRYTYSLRDGIEDGFLTPFKVKKVSTTIDTWKPGPGDIVLEGEVEQEEYGKEDMNRKIIIAEREEALVKIMLQEMNEVQKAIVFCMSEKHALMIRDFINKHKKSNDADYCVRVTASEGAVGDQWLKIFRDNEKTIPTILTTSQKLSTGVDARNLRYVVLMRPVGSMVEFKQIVGRGTRVYEGKDHFTIIDFYDNHEKFSDKDWDGPPEEVETKVISEVEENGEKVEKTLKEVIDDAVEKPEKKQMLKVQFAPHRTAFMDSMIETLYFDGDGKPVSPEQFLKDLFSKLPDFFSDEEALRKIWSNQDTRNKLIDELAERGFDLGKLLKLRDSFKAEDSDIYDLLRFVAFDKEIISRKDRLSNADIHFKDKLDEKNQEFVEFVMSQYEKNGFESLNDLTNLINLKYGNSSVVEDMGGVSTVKGNFETLQAVLYAK
ncbi:MAG: DEAD/DEAH box helicase family protein [Bdellovibrionales bacterium]|nr:DEAD/DEAH box helicase family protein [Bdellovibrionales bacterium]